MPGGGLTPSASHQQHGKRCLIFTNECLLHGASGGGGGCWEKAPWKPEPRSTQLCLCLLTPPQEMQLFCLAGISAQNFQHPHKSVTKAAHQYTVYEVTGRKRKLWSISMSAKMTGRSQLMREAEETVLEISPLKNMLQSECQHPWIMEA